MPLPVEDLGVALWRVALPFLAEPSTRCPPTGCQLLLYYPLFLSAIGRHRTILLDSMSNDHKRVRELPTSLPSTALTRCYT